MAIYPLIKRNTLNQVFGDFEKEISRIFDRSEGYDLASTAAWVPPIDIKDEDKQFVVHIDIPGVELKNIDVSVDNNTLIVKGERESEKKEEKIGYVRIERAKGAFYRSLSLPDIADTAKIDAKVDQGVLTVTIPKREQSIAKRIEVKTMPGHSS